MALPLEQIDTSLTEDLMGLKRDREVLAARLARMTTEVDKVSTPVFERVRADYQSRLAELDRRAEPQKEQARREYAKLRKVLEEVATQRASALQDQEELEFRHRLGEFEDSEFAAKNTEVAQRLAGLERELAAISAVRDRFVAAFDSEAELTQPPAAAAPAAAAESAAAPAEAPPLAVPPAVPEPAAIPATPDEAAEPAPSTRSGKQRTLTTANAVAASGTGAQPATATGTGGLPAASGTGAQQPAAAPVDPQAADAPMSPPNAGTGVSVEATPAADASPDAVASVQPPPQPSEDGDSTIAAARPNRQPGQEAEAPPPIPLPVGAGTVVLTDLDKIAAAANTDPALGGTLIVSFGRLVPLDPADADAVEFRVQPFTTIGRTRQNNIQLDAPSVSRKHAQIALTETGYMVRDLGSENGTFVNGERVAERLLADGDHLQFGGVRFSFHTGT